MPFDREFLDAPLSTIHVVAEVLVPFEPPVDLESDALGPVVPALCTLNVRLGSNEKIVERGARLLLSDASQTKAVDFSHDGQGKAIKNTTVAGVPAYCVRIQVDPSSQHFLGQDLFIHTEHEGRHFVALRALIGVMHPLSIVVVAPPQLMGLTAIAGVLGKQVQCYSTAHVALRPDLKLDFEGRSDAFLKTQLGSRLTGEGEAQAIRAELDAREARVFCTRSLLDVEIADPFLPRELRCQTLRRATAVIEEMAACDRWETWSGKGRKVDLLACARYDPQRETCDTFVSVDRKHRAAAVTVASTLARHAGSKVSGSPSEFFGRERTSAGVYRTVAIIDPSGKLPHVSIVRETNPSAGTAEHLVFYLADISAGDVDHLIKSLNGIVSKVEQLTAGEAKAGDDTESDDDVDDGVHARRPRMLEDPVNLVLTGTGSFTRYGCQGVIESNRALHRLPLVVPRRRMRNTAGREEPEEPEEPVTAEHLAAWDDPVPCHGDIGGFWAGRTATMTVFFRGAGHFVLLCRFIRAIKYIRHSENSLAMVREALKTRSRHLNHYADVALVPNGTVADAEHGRRNGALLRLDSSLYTASGCRLFDAEGPPVAPSHHLLTFEQDSSLGQRIRSVHRDLLSNLATALSSVRSSAATLPRLCEFIDRNGTQDFTTGEIWYNPEMANSGGIVVCLHADTLIKQVEAACVHLYYAELAEVLAGNMELDWVNRADGEHMCYPFLVTGDLPDDIPSAVASSARQPETPEERCAVFYACSVHHRKSQRAELMEIQTAVYMGRNPATAFVANARPPGRDTASLEVEFGTWFISRLGTKDLFTEDGGTARTLPDVVSVSGSSMGPTHAREFTETLVVRPLRATVNKLHRLLPLVSGGLAGQVRAALARHTVALRQLEGMSRGVVLATGDVQPFSVEAMPTVVDGVRRALEKIREVRDLVVRAIEICATDDWIRPPDKAPKVAAAKGEEEKAVPAKRRSPEDAEPNGKDEAGELDGAASPEKPPTKDHPHTRANDIAKAFIATLGKLRESMTKPAAVPEENPAKHIIASLLRGVYRHAAEITGHDMADIRLCDGVAPRHRALDSFFVSSMLLAGTGSITDNAVQELVGKYGLSLLDRATAGDDVPSAFLAARCAVALSIRLGHCDPATLQPTKKVKPVDFKFSTIGTEQLRVSRTVQNRRIDMGTVRDYPWFYGAPGSTGPSKRIDWVKGLVDATKKARATWPAKEDGPIKSMSMFETEAARLAFRWKMATSPAEAIGFTPEEKQCATSWTELDSDRDRMAVLSAALALAWDCLARFARRVSGGKLKVDQFDVGLGVRTHLGVVRDSLAWASSMFPFVLLKGTVYVSSLDMHNARMALESLIPSPKRDAEAPPTYSPAVAAFAATDWVDVVRDTARSVFGIAGPMRCHDAGFEGTVEYEGEPLLRDRDKDGAELPASTRTLIDKISADLSRHKQLVRVQGALMALAIAIPGGRLDSYLFVHTDAAAAEPLPKKPKKPSAQSPKKAPTKPRRKAPLKDPRFAIIDAWCQHGVKLISESKPAEKRPLPKGSKSKNKKPRPAVPIAQVQWSDRKVSVPEAKDAKEYFKQLCGNLKSGLRAASLFQRKDVPLDYSFGGVARAVSEVDSAMVNGEVGQALHRIEDVLFITLNLSKPLQHVVRTIFGLTVVRALLCAGRALLGSSVGIYTGRSLATTDWIAKACKNMRPPASVYETAYRIHADQRRHGIRTFTAPPPVEKKEQGTKKRGRDAEEPEPAKADKDGARADFLVELEKWHSDGTDPPHANQPSTYRATSFVRLLYAVVLHAEVALSFLDEGLASLVVDDDGLPDGNAVLVALLSGNFSSAQQIERPFPLHLFGDGGMDLDVDEELAVRDGDLNVQIKRILEH